MPGIRYYLYVQGPTGPTESLLKATMNRSVFPGPREHGRGWGGQRVRAVYQGPWLWEGAKLDLSMSISKRVLWEGPGGGQELSLLGRLPPFLFPSPTHHRSEWTGESHRLRPLRGSVFCTPSSRCLPGSEVRLQLVLRPQRWKWGGSPPLLPVGEQLRGLIITQ